MLGCHPGCDGNHSQELTQLTRRCPRGFIYESRLIRAGKVCLSFSVGILPPAKMPHYLSELSTPKCRRAFIPACLNAIPLAATRGRFSGSPHLNRLCSRGSDKIDAVDRIFFDGPKFSELRAELISPLFHQNSPSPEMKPSWLLRDKNKHPLSGKILGGCC